ncbi:AbrB/MazE/SpoVT family DNA-binding domain-containing protein [Dyadobacter arcticus]|uniref:Antitoxin MazE n=1 Tax=Dyadobacter arcticus TaxID=1078754 RepID=A0ABX0ULX6_9BACT|nr:AbrB/MazE/SpoVT family DNA-binding domain-containing protein [Dyadobacter arcticus]NIJ54004.1 antitoxin MazE [Dyadobacter arcticus]
MLVRVRRIGNSQGVILSKTMMDQCDIKDMVNVEVKGNAIVIEPVTHKPREGWAKQFQIAGPDSNEDLMGNISNEFDDSDWTW